MYHQQRKNKTPNSACWYTLYSKLCLFKIKKWKSIKLLKCFLALSFRKILALQNGSFFWQWVSYLNWWAFIFVNKLLTISWSLSLRKYGSRQFFSVFPLNNSSFYFKTKLFSINQTRKVEIWLCYLYSKKSI